MELVKRRYFVVKLNKLLKCLYSKDTVFSNKAGLNGQ